MKITLASICQLGVHAVTFQVPYQPLLLAFQAGFTMDQICLLGRLLFFSVTAIPVSLQGNEECSVVAAAGIACWQSQLVLKGGGMWSCFCKAGISKICNSFPGKETLVAFRKISL